MMVHGCWNLGAYAKESDFCISIISWQMTTLTHDNGLNETICKTACTHSYTWVFDTSLSYMCVLVFLNMTVSIQHGLLLLAVNFPQTCQIL